MIEISRVDINLLEWAAYRKSENPSAELDVSISSIYPGAGISGFDDLGDVVDVWKMETIDGCINAMGEVRYPRYEAIHYHYLGTKEFWNDTHPIDLDDAMHDLAARFDKKGIV